VIGDDHVAASAEFHDLKTIHLQMIAALASRSPAIRKLLRAVKLKAAELPVNLTEFYRRLSHRTEHFFARCGPERRRASQLTQVMVGRLRVGAA
jgi:adenylate cyclase